MAESKDRSSEIVHLAARILEAANLAIEKSTPYLKETDKRPDIAIELLVILNGADDLMEIFDPSKDAAEYFGIAREATIRGDEAEVTFQDADGWDFKPWCCDKALSVKDGVKSTIKYWEKDVADVRLAPSAPMTPREWVRSGVLEGLYSARRDAQKIFDMTFNDEVSAEERDS